MPVFAYKATDAGGVIVRGTVIGDSPRHARDQIRDQGLRIVEVRESQSTRDRGVSWPGASHRVRSKLATVSGELATLLAVGVPLVEALATLAGQYRGTLGAVLMRLQDSVASGKRLAESMREQPEVFDRLACKMVEVGENAGSLEIVLRQLSDFLRKSNQFRDRILTALLYPLIILAVSIVVTLFLMSVVVPMLLDNLVEAGRPLPWPTRLLKAGSDLLVQHGGWLAIATVIVGTCTWLWLRTDAGRRLWHTTILKIPILGTMSRKQEISRISLIIATLLRSGVEFLDALKIVKDTSSNPLLCDALNACRQQIEAGRDIGAAMQQQTFFPAMVVQVYTIGQHSGRLDEMLERLAADFDEQVDSVAARLSTAVEPVLILGLSVFVGFILFATLLPILEASNVL